MRKLMQNRYNTWMKSPLVIPLYSLNLCYSLVHVATNFFPESIDMTTNCFHPALINHLECMSIVNYILFCPSLG